MKGILGKKIGMAQIADEKGLLTGVTLVEITPNTVLQIKQLAEAGKSSLVLATGDRNKQKKNVYQNFAFIREISFDSVENVAVQGKLGLELFQVGEKVHITGVSKGKGFQGVMKRHNFAGNPDSHGHEDHREPGGFGGRTWPGRVAKGRKLPGHMGLDQVTVKNRSILAIDPEMMIVAIKGPLPGGINSFVKIWQ
ncbi:50S ribosomal protein L3 [Candidatus Gracilibacteria bacterium]|jgi:large subunit ribosomal protein L3|nr:50S ribosomal protein L3 [Candidatus Gracilibacteria bacterium]